MALGTLADLATRAPRNGNSKLCDTCWLLANLDPADSANLDAALRNSAVKYVEIQEALVNAGHHVDVSSISRHARGRCSARDVCRGGAA